jgi:aspartyl aminopeptidase
MNDPVTEDLLAFIHAGSSPFHAVAEGVRRLEEAGFVRLDEAGEWSLAPKGRYFIVRGETSLCAFVMGQAPVAEAGFRLVGAHTDSPNLRLKPQAEHEREGYRRLGVETYGGVLLQTWIDRDLGISGRIVVDDGAGGQSSHLVRSDRPVARIPRVAIHLDTKANDEGIGNRQVDLVPIYGLEDESPEFSAWLRELAGVTPEAEILATDLMLHVVEPPTVGGLDGSFIFAPRLDNLASCHAGLSALIARAEDAVDATRVVVLYDHEEVGSTSMQGAAGSLISDLLNRIGSGEDLARAKAQSFFLSVDMAHAVHPHHPEKHDPEHKPVLNGGPVIKYNANARYATDGESAARFKRLCREAQVPVQEFVMRTDMPCGSTIGPIVASQLGIRTLDVGCAMLSMHSAREMSGAHDQSSMQRVLDCFFS